MSSPKQELYALRLGELSLVGGPANDVEVLLFKSTNQEATVAELENKTNPVDVVLKSIAEASKLVAGLKGQPISADIRKGINEIITDGAAVLTEVDVEKRNPQFSKERMAQLKSTLTGLANMYKEIDPEGFSEMWRGNAEPHPATTVPAGKTPASGIKDQTMSKAASADDIVEAVSKSVKSAVSEGLKPTQDAMAELTKRVSAIENTKGISKTVAEDTTAKPVTKSNAAFWKGLV